VELKRTEGVTMKDKEDLPVESALEFAAQLQNGWVFGRLVVIKAMSGTNVTDELTGSCRYSRNI
jgi:hypothetical protein